MLFRALLSANRGLYSAKPMTAYNLKPPQDLPTPPAWQEAKEKRKQQHGAVRRRRREIYKRFMQRQQKRQLQATDDLL